MKVKVTVGTTYCGCPSESFEIECDSIEDFEQNDAYSTEILNRISNFETPHFFIDFEYDEDEDSMTYYKIECNNGYCGCDETFYVALSEDEDIDEYAQDVLENRYAFYEPDGRFIPGKSWGDDITDEEYDDYMEDLSVDWEEISKEEYEKHKGE